ncbi:alpha/beta fold hydrolase [Domibacillus robiginosus]|uniref:alpha/beta fold hydrolase n=1 Tax=Domibacillus robiginosus TaxID=1071054 RepID=UPI00067CF56C|nr:alpha/beta hydrolase [Domibacillus robiginosus]
MQEKVIRLSDGRHLGYWEYGDKRGVPVFLFHGTPGSRIWFLNDDPTAQSLGIRFIATDRPGYGLSDQKQNRQLLDWATDIKELADFLNIKLFSVLGVSGGGAYAAAVSHTLPEQTQLCLLISTAAPFQDGKLPKDMSKENRIAFFLSKRFPWLLNKLSHSQKKMIDQQPERYQAALKKGGRHLPEWDNRQLLKEGVAESTLLHSKEAYRQGVKGVSYETRLLMKNWGFNLGDIQVPVQIWHGEKDTLSPVSEVKKMARQFKHVESFYIKDGGHFLTEEEEIWTAILQTVLTHTRT